MQVDHHSEESRFVISLEAGESWISYRLNNDSVNFYQTYVQPENRGSKVGILLVQTAVDWAIAQQLNISASCWYVDKYLQKHGLKP